MSWVPVVWLSAPLLSRHTSSSWQSGPVIFVSMTAPFSSQLHGMENPKWQEIRCCDGCSIVRSYPTLCDPMDCSTPGLLCPSLSPRVCSDLHWLSWWCYPNISSSDAPFSFCPQYFPASGSFPVSQQEVGWWAWVWPLAETPYIPPLHSPSHTCACEHTLTQTPRLWDEDF